MELFQGWAGGMRKMITEVAGFEALEKLKIADDDEDYCFFESFLHKEGQRCEDIYPLS